MALLAWDDSGGAVAKEIDLQCQGLAAMVKDLCDALRQGGAGNLAPLLSGLDSRASRRFSREENLMIRYKYPDFPQHKAEHDAFIEKINDLQGERGTGEPAASLKAAQFLRDSLMSHMLGADQRCLPFFEDKGLL